MSVKLESPTNKIRSWVVAAVFVFSTRFMPRGRVLGGDGGGCPGGLCACDGHEGGVCGGVACFVGVKGGILNVSDGTQKKLKGAKRRHLMIDG